MMNLIERWAGVRRKNERWADIQRRKRHRDAVIDTVCGIMIVPMFYVLTCLVFCL